MLWKNQNKRRPNITQHNKKKQIRPSDISSRTICLLARRVLSPAKPYESPYPNKKSLEFPKIPSYTISPNIPDIGLVGKVTLGASCWKPWKLCCWHGMTWTPQLGIEGLCGIWTIFSWELGFAVEVETYNGIRVFSDISVLQIGHCGFTLCERSINL